MLPTEDIARQLTELRKRIESLDRQRNGANRLIDSAVLAAPAATVTFANIPNIYEYLLILYYARSAFAGNDNLQMRFNVDVGANYDWLQTVIWTGGLATTSAIAANFIITSIIAGSTAPANTFSMGSTRINDYANVTNHKTCMGHGSLKSANLGGNIYRTLNDGYWRNVNPITSITLFLASWPGNLIADSRFDLYGIQGGA